MQQENTPITFRTPLTRTELETWMPEHIRRLSAKKEEISSPIRFQVLVYGAVGTLPREAIFTLETDKTIRAFWGVIRGEG